MKLKIHSVQDKGNLEKEAVWFDVLSDIPNVGNHLVCDSTYTDDGKISNRLRHLFWFPDFAVARGDWIKLLTKSGKSSRTGNDRNTSTHLLYWGLNETVWNEAGDCAVLFDVADWAFHKA